MSNLFSTGGAGNVGFSGEVQQSLKFNDDESQYLSWTPASAGNRKTFTYSSWVKRGKINADNPHWGMSAGTLNNSSNARTEMLFNPSDNIVIGFNTGSWYESTTDAKFRDASAWYHFVVTVDMTQSTASDRLKFYVNGELQTFSSYSVPSQNTDLPINHTLLHGIGEYIAGESSASYQFDGYLSDINFIDGQALDPTSFGQFTNGYWEKIDYAGSYGTNGFHLTFQDDVVSEGFNAVTFTAKSSAAESVSGLGFAPDFVWTKARNTTQSHQLFDSVRGDNNILYTNLTNAESAQSAGYFTLENDGFNYGSSTFSANTYVGWAWDAGTGSAASNTDGSITSTVKANPDYGFSVCSWVHSSTTSTIGHGLTTAPNLIILKSRTTAYNWDVGSDDIGWGNRMNLNSTAAAYSPAFWNSTAPTSSVFTYAGSGATNGDNMIAYCFNSVANYSYISSYSGTGATGHKITTGFSPALIMLKRHDSGSAEDWLIYDNTRNPANLSGNEYVLRPNTSGAEQAYGSIDFESDGFTLQTVGGALNASGGSYLVMAFADTREAAFWKDVSTNGNHWTPNNLDYRDSLPDSPANNFAVLNALDLASGFTLSEGNLQIATSTSGARSSFGNFIPPSGKWYFEANVTVINAIASWANFGVAPEASLPSTDPQSSSGGISFQDSGRLFVNGSDTDDWIADWAVGDILQCAFDADTGKVWLGKNNTYGGSGNPASGSNETGTISGKIKPLFGQNSGGTRSTTLVYNFGQDSTFSGTKPMGAYTDDSELGTFQHQPPAGFKSLCTANLPTPTIIDGSEHFNTVLWTGDSVDNRNITGIGFDADFTWFKARSNANSNGLADTVRGNSAPNMLSSNSTNAEFDWTGIFKGHITDGFTVGTDSAINFSGQTYASWNWKAGGTAVSNTDGSVTSQVSANTTAGFSIATFTGGSAGYTVGHGLSQAPEIVFTFNRTDSGGANYVFTTAVDGTIDYLSLNATTAASNDPFSMPAFTSTVFSLDNDYGMDTGDNCVAYCFHSVEGFSKVGNFLGNGNADGPFVFTGFRPAAVMVKWSNGSQDWILFDNKRPGFNETDKYLHPSSSAAEGDYDTLEVDLLSNGFKCRGPYNHINTSGGTYIYLAFAETPFKYANAR